jgi:hypothetical protein
MFGLTPERRMDAGLIRDIYLEKRPPSFTASVLFHSELSENRGRAACSLSVEIDGDARGTTLEAMLQDAGTGRRISGASSPAGKPILFDVNEPRLWSP